MNRLARSRSRSRAADPLIPVTASQSGPLRRPRIDVRSRKALSSARQPVQDLLAQVVDDMAARPGELGHEPRSIGTFPERQSRQVEPGRPALGACLERLHGARIEIEPQRPIQELRRPRPDRTGAGPPGSPPALPWLAGDPAAGPGRPVTR